MTEGHDWSQAPQPQPQPQQGPQTQPPAPSFPPQAYRAPEPTGGAKAGYFALGFLMMLVGVLISWLITKDKGEAVKSAGLKFSLIGLASGVVFYVLLSIGLTACSLMILYA